MIRPFIKEIIESMNTFPLKWKETSRGIKREDDRLLIELPTNYIFFFQISTPYVVQLGFQESWIMHRAIAKWKREITLGQVMSGKVYN